MAPSRNDARGGGATRANAEILGLTPAATVSGFVGDGAAATNANIHGLTSVHSSEQKTNPRIGLHLVALLDVRKLTERFPLLRAAQLAFGPKFWIVGRTDHLSELSLQLQKGVGRVGE